MTDDEQKVDRVVRWSRAELARGQANADVHGLDDELQNLTPSDPDRADDDKQDKLSMKKSSRRGDRG